MKIHPLLISQCTGVQGHKKWNGGANGARQMFDDIFSPMDTIQECDR